MGNAATVFARTVLIRLTCQDDFPSQNDDCRTGYDVIVDPEEADAGEGADERDGERDRANQVLTDRLFHESHPSRSNDAKTFRFCHYKFVTKAQQSA